jgi:hypothetical protein
MHILAAADCHPGHTEKVYRPKIRMGVTGFIALGICFIAGSAAAQPHDGRWSGVARVDTPGCGADVPLNGEMGGNQFRGQGMFPSGGPAFDWAVTPDGGVHGNGMQGRISANRLSGTWQRLTNGRICSYRIELTRR